MEVVTDAVLNLAIFLVELLPQSPFLAIQDIQLDAKTTEILSYVNYFVPVTSWVAVLQAWLFAIALYYVYSIVLRYINMIS